MATEYNACVDLLDRNVEGGRADHPAVVTRGRSVTYADLLGEVRATAAGLRRIGVAPRAAGRHGDARLHRVLRRLPRHDAHRRRAGPGEPAAARPRPRRHRRQQPRPRPRGLGRAGRRGRRDPRRRSRGRDRDRDRLARVGLAHRRAAQRRRRPATPPRPGTSPRASGCAPPGRRAGPSWPCTATSTCGSRPTPTPPQVLGVGADDRCYSVGPMFHAYGLGNSLTFPFAAGATAIVEPTRPPTPALVGEIVATLRPTLLFCIPTFYAALAASELAGRHVLVGALGGLGRRAAAGRDVPTVPGALRRADPRRHRLHRDDPHLHLQPTRRDPAGHVGPTGAGLRRRRGRRRRAPGRGRRRPVTSRSPATRWPPATGATPPRPGAPSAASGCAAATCTRARRTATTRTSGAATTCSASAASGCRRPRWRPRWSPAPSVLEAAVVAHPDEAGVARPVAYVVAAPGQTIDTAELEVLCKAELAGYKRPKRYVVVPELPKTATGQDPPGRAPHQPPRHLTRKRCLCDTSRVRCSGIRASPRRDRLRGRACGCCGRRARPRRGPSASSTGGT